ncbi:MAG: tol-pal system protein YbgF [Proteobacteria bacterium]|nr:tol-pal system protein YbgF [Pseudomonadota bacterium]
MRKIFFLFVLFLTGCSMTQDRNQAEYFKDFQTQLLALSQRVEVLESKIQRDMGLKSSVYDRVDKLEEKMRDTDDTLTKLKSHPLFEGLDTVKLQPAPSSTVITIKPSEVEKLEKQATKAQVEEVKQAERVKDDAVLKAKVGEATVVRTNPAVLYNQGYEMYLSGKYAQAITIFREFLQNFPNDSLADNAQYWIGECYYSQKMFDRAITEFKKTENYPDGNKVPDAYLKIYYSYNELGKKDEANQWKKLLLEKFGNSEAAKKVK